MSLMVDEKAERRDHRAIVIERDHVVTARRSIPKHENPAGAFGAKVDKLVT